MARLDAAIPTSPLVDAGGNIRPEWRAFFTSLWIRTGGALGQATDTAALEAQLAAEEAARVQADTNLGTALTQETQARQQGDNNEAQARQSSDDYIIRLLQLETQARQVDDTTLVPKSQLCSLWAACDLSFLPTADPGLGQPWLNGGVVTVGTSPGTISALLLEDASGDWMLETGGAGNDWQWG